MARTKYAAMPMPRKRAHGKQPSHILTLRQIKEIGQAIKLPNLANAMETLMQPANLFLMSRQKLMAIHDYLLDRRLTSIQQPSSKLKLPDHARLLISLIYPGYPLSKAQDLACRKGRESRTAARKNAEAFAYDQLPCTEFLDRGDEFMRIKLQPSLSSCASHYSCSIGGKALSRAISPTDSFKSLSRRMLLYLWLSPRLCLTPHCTSLLINGIETWDKDDQMTVNQGYKHIDITEKFDWNKLTSSKESATIDFYLDDADADADLQYATIIFGWKKSSLDMLCQLYMSTSSKLMSDALSNSKTIDTTQQEAVQLFDRCPPELRWTLGPVQDLFLDVGRLFYQPVSQDDEDDDLVCGREYISLMDPVMLSKIHHPCKSIFCRHASCFDAKCYFDLMKQQQAWACPLCHIQLRGSQDLFIDYPLKRMIATYPDADRFVKDADGTYLNEDQCSDRTTIANQPPLAPIVIKPIPLDD
ncbi:hypothetical protein DM01DRAFT_1411692 [Hesseltinella vesiculosa]|uniref:SP-RING-type domain-containing protein n=1 Tax=Hesseltinella vesiculosa TaxID=101127 RepID=A0A1X2G2T9_9FUNG|nr:hypothetical protein DM01DRAFT_1411692 [Hesseltinella vesiculosa]